MSIGNNIGITSYRRNMARGFEGQAASARLPECRTYVNPKPKQVSELTVGGTAADGDYVATITEPDGTTLTVTFTRGSGEANAAIAVALTAAIVAAIDGNLAGVVEGATDSDTNDTQLTFEHEGIAYQVSGTAPAGATLTHTLITDPAGVDVPIGRFVVQGVAAQGGQTTIAVPTAAAETAIIGITMRPLGQYVNGESGDASQIDQIKPGQLASVAYEGPVLMRNVGADATRHGQVHVVVATAGGDEIGQARGDDDGANSVTLPARNAYWAEDTASGEVGPVFVRL